MNTPIHDFLENYKKTGAVRCHMPGGKGVRYPADITEIEGADSLFESSGIILRSEQNASALFGSQKTLYSCAGSTLAIQTMLALAKAHSPDKKRIVSPRFAHRSLISSCALLDLEVDWVYSDDYLCCNVSPEAIEEKITAQTLAVFIASTDYFGNRTEVEKIAEICRGRNVPLLCDNAHGAYRVFTGNHPNLLGAAMVADSAHKTLPAITGTAYLHINDSRFIPRSKELMALFGSSSPSYLMLESLDLCNAYIAKEKDAAKKAFEEIDRLKKRLASMGFTLEMGDEVRIVINSAACGYSGNDFAKKLRTLLIEPEMNDDERVVLLFSTSAEKNELLRVEKAFEQIELLPSLEIKRPTLPQPKTAITPRQAVFSPQKKIPVRDALGKICGAVLAPCPPCVPPVMPGEVIDEAVIETLLYYGAEEISVI